MNSLIKDILVASSIAITAMLIAFLLIMPNVKRNVNTYWECSEYKTDGYECECDDAENLMLIGGRTNTQMQSQRDLTGYKCLNESYIKYLARNNLWSFCMSTASIEKCPTENIEYWSCTPIKTCTKEVMVRNVN